MPSPLYDLYKERYELSLSEPDFEKQLKGNATFRNNFQKKLRESGMTEEAIATHFAGGVPKQKIPTIKEQPAQLLQESGINPGFSPMATGLNNVLPKAEPLEKTPQNPIEDRPVLESESPDYSNLYSDDLYRLANFVGLEKKYPKEVISANLDDKEFSNRLISDLKKTGLVDEDLEKLKNGKQYQQRGRYYQLFGVDPKRLKLSDKEIESQYQEGIQFKQQMLPKLSDKNVSFKDLLSVHSITNEQEKLLESDPKKAFDYFKTNIKNNPSLSAMYKGHLANEIQQRLGQDNTSIDIDIYTPELQALSDYYKGQNKELESFRLQNKEGFDKEMGSVSDRFARASLVLKGLIEKSGLENKRYAQEHERKKTPMLASPMISGGAGVDVRTSDDVLTRNAIVMRNDVERLLKQYKDTNGFRDFSTGVAQGIKSPLWDAESLGYLIPVIKKEQDGKPLSRAEQTALRSYALLSTVQSMIPTSIGYKVGEATPQSLEFMASLMLASPLYSGIKEGIKEVGEKELKAIALNKAKGMLAKTLAKGMKQWAPDLAGMLAGNILITPTQPMFYNEIAKEIAGQTKLKQNKQGGFSDLNVDTSKALKQDVAKSIFKAYYHTTVESVSESLGEYGDLALSRLSKNKVWKAMTGGAEGSAWRQKARLNGVLMENLEEWVNPFLNAPVDGVEGIKQTFEPENLLVIAMSTGIFTVPGFAGAKYNTWRNNKYVGKLRTETEQSLGADKFKTFEEGMQSANTLNQRGEFVMDFFKKNTLTKDQQQKLRAYGVALTVNQINGGDVSLKGKGLGIADVQTEKDLRLIGKTELTGLVKTELPDQYQALIDKRTADLANPDIDNKTARLEFQKGFNALLSDPKVAEKAKLLQQQMTGLKLPEKTTAQLVSNELTAASEKPKKDAIGQEAEETKGMNSDQLRSRVRNTFFQLKSAKTEEEKNTLTAKRDYLVGKIRDQHRQSELQRLRLYDQGTQDRTSYTDQNGQKVKVEVSPELMDTNSAIDNFVSTNNELKDRKKQLDAPMPLGLSMKEQEDWKRVHQEQLDQYEKDVLENTRQKSLAETRHMELFGAAPKGKQIAETSLNETQVGQDVVVEDRISGARVQGKVVQKTDNKAIIEYETLPQNGTSSRKYQMVYTAGTGRLHNLYEAKEIVHEQRSGIVGDFAKLKSGVHKSLFTDKEVLKQYNAIRSDDNQRNRWFDSEATAKEERAKAVREWGEGLITPVFYNKDKNAYVFSMRKGRMEKPQQTTRRERYLAWVQQYRQLQEYFASMSPEELTDYNARMDQEDNSPEKSVDEYIAFKKQYLESLNEQRNDDTDLEQELREVKVIRSAQALAKATGVKLTIVQSDPTGRNRKGWQEGNKYYINLSQATGDTPVHEYAHPIMDVIEQENKHLFDALFDEISATLEGQEIIALVEKLYSDKSEQYRRKEALVTALGKRGELALKNDLSPFAQAVYRLWNAVKNFLAHKINIGKLTPDTALNELAQMIVTGRVKAGIENAETNEQRTGNLNIWYSSGENASLSNLAARKFNYEGKDYLSVEHAYQTLKSGKFDDKTYNAYRRAGVKIIGQMGTKTDNGWNLSLMKNLVKASFDQNPDAARILTDTDGAIFTHNQDNGIWKKEFPRILTEVRNELLNQSKTNSLQSQIIQAVNEKKPVWIFYQSNRAKEQGEPATWRKVEEGILSEDQTQISGLSNGENKTFNIADSERIKGFSLTEPDDINAQNKSVHRIFDGGSPFQYKGGFNGNIKGSVFRYTGPPQIEDIKTNGVVKSRGKINGGHVNEVHWSRANEKLSYPPTESRYILEADENDVLNKVGALNANDLKAIWTFRDGEWVDIKSEIVKNNFTKSENITTPVITTEKPVYATEAWKETMSATFDTMKSLLSENQAKEPKEREKKSALQQKAVKAGVVVFTKTDYYKLLSTQKKRGYNQILQDQLTKMLKKQKTVLVEDGKSALMEVEAIEGVAATSEDKLKQFMTGVTPQVKEIASRTGIPEYRVKLSLIDMMQDELLVHNEKDFAKLESKFTDKDHLLISKAILETGDFSQYVSLANFFGSLHLEDQVGITISKGVASMYNQAMSVTQRNMRTDFQKFYLSLDDKASQELQDKIDKYNKWNNDRNLKSEQQGLGIVMDKTYLTATKKLLSVLTGLDLNVVEEYFNNPQVTKGMYYKDGTAVPSGTTLNQLEGKSLYFKNKNGQTQAQRGIPIISSFLSKYSRNLKEPEVTLPVLIKNHFNSRVNGYSNLDWLITSYTSNEQPGTEGTDVEGNRFQTFALSHQLYDQSLKIKDLIEDKDLKAYYERIPMKIQKFNGFHNNDLNKAFSGTKVDGKPLWFGMLLHFRNSVAGEYQQFLGQFSDKTAVYTGNVLKVDGKENYDRAKEINPQIDSDIQYIHDLITKDYWQLLGFKAADTQQMADLARDFAVNFTVNLHALTPVMHGNVKAYKNMADMIKRAQVVISPGYKYKIDLKDGIRKQMRYVIADDYIMRDLQGKGVEQLDGLNFGSEDFMKQAQKSSGTAFAREKDFKDMTSIKAVVTYVDSKGERVLIKSHVSSIGVLANSGMGEIYSQVRDYMRKHDIDVLSFPSSAKKTGGAEKTSLFYNDFIPSSDAENSLDITDFVNSLRLDQLVDTKNENPEIVSNPYLEERDAERKFIEETGKEFNPTETGAYEDLRDAISEAIDAQKLNDLKTLVAEANKQGKKGIYHAGIGYGQDVSTALNEIIQQRLQTQTIQGLEDQNAPSVLEVPREAFYIQQDLRHENTAHAQDISSQMYTNMMALEGFDNFIKNLTDANQLQYDFSKEFFAGFKDVEIVKQYLLWNTDPTEDPDFYKMLQAWAINDPGFQRQMVSKLVNTVNRDVLEIRINRQSSTELPDMTGRLRGIKKTFYNGQEYTQLPEIGLNIPGLRYAKEFDTSEEARQWMVEYRDELVDLQDKEGRPQLWQIYQDKWTGKWIVPGEPVVSSRTPAGNLNCHTVARARFRLAGDAAVTMLDIKSRRASGSDFDGDARYNWTFSKVKGGNIVDDTYYGKINQALMALVDEYQNPVNFDKINDPIDTEAFDEIIKEIEGEWTDDAINPSSIQAQGTFRSRNMMGYNMKAIMSNLTTVFSYLKYFNVEKIVKDDFNELKVDFDNTLNLSFDNAKDPKIEKLGLNDITASMFSYELMTDKRIDQAKTKEDARKIMLEIMRELCFKYSPFSKIQDKWIKEFLETSEKINSDIIQEWDTVVQVMKNNNMVEGDSDKMKVNPEMQPFLDLYQKSKSLDFFNRIKGLRDDIPNQLPKYLLAKANLSEFTFGNNHFFDQANIINQDTEKPALRAIYNAMDLAGHIFDLVPGMRFIDHLSALHLSTTNQLKAERKQFKQAQSLRNEQKEINPLTSMIHLPYLLKLRDASFTDTRDQLMDYLRKYRQAQEQGIDHLNPEFSHNDFLDALIMDEGVKVIAVAPSIRNTKLSEQYEQQLKNGFALLPEDVRRKFTYYTLLEHGFSESIRGGGFFALVDTDSRVKFSQYKYTQTEQSVLNDVIYTRIENEFIQKAEQKVSDRQNAKNVAIDDIRKILKEEKTSFDFSKIQQGNVQKMLDFLHGKTEGSPYTPESVNVYMKRIGLKSAKELERTLQAVSRSFGNVRYQHSESRNGTETALMDPELFVFMFEHFKKVYPGLSVFTDVQEFVSYIERQTGRTGNFDLSAIGAAFGMAVHINPNTAKQDTFFHEVSHVYWDALPETDQVKKRLRLLYGWHSDMSQEQTDQIDELIIEDIGLTGTDVAKLRFEGSRLDLFMDCLKQFWNAVKSVFGLTEGSRRQAKILYSQRIMADRVWQGGISQSEIANSQLIRYQTTGKTDQIPGSQTITLPNGKIVTSGHSYFDSQIQYNRSVLNLANSEWKKAQAELATLAMQPVGQRTPSPGSNIRIDSEGKAYIIDANGNMVSTGSTESVLDQEKFINAYIANQNRMGVISAAVSNMLDWSQSGILMPTFKLDGADVYLDDFFSKPTEVFRQLTDTIEKLQQDYGLSGKLSVNAVVYDDQADHVSSMDILSTDPAGNTTVIRFFPTYEDYVKDGVKTPSFQGSRGSFLPGSALDGESTSKENEIRIQMIQFSTMYNAMHEEKNSPSRVTRMIAVPLKITNGQDQKAESMEVQQEQVYIFGQEEETLGKRILSDVRTQKSAHRSYNISSVLKGVKNAVTVNSREAIKQGIEAIRFLQSLTHSASVRISTHMANITARNGYGKLIYDVLHSGLGWKDYHIGMDQKGTYAKAKFTLKFSKKENGSGLLIYGSPGWGKAYAQGYHEDIIDSQVLLEQVLTSGHQALLFGKSDKAKQLQAYSLRHPVDKTGFGGHIRKEEISYDNIIASYHTNGEEMNLFAFNTSLLIYKLRQQAIADLIAQGTDLETVKNDINAVRAATSSMTGEEVEMIRIDTPYEELQQNIDRQLNAGKHVLSSTLLDKEFNHLINLKYDKVYRLVSDVKDKKENMDRQSRSARQLMHQRTSDPSGFHPIDYTEQGWIQQRFQLEIDRFGEDVTFTDGYATDDIFNESVYTHREKITTLRQLWLIRRLGITYGQFETEARQRQGLTIATYLEEKEKEHYSKMDQADSEAVLSFLNEESMNVLQLEAFKGMGLKENPQSNELAQMIHRYKSNFKSAQALWKELGRMMDFIENSDNITAQTSGQYRLKQEYLLDLFNQIQKLDKINQSGLYEIVAGQISMNYIIRKVSEEAQDMQPDGTRGRTYRIHTIALAKMMKDPDYSWIPNEDRVRWLGIEWSGIIRAIAGGISTNLKLDRAVDARHPLAQALVLARMDTHHSIMSEITSMTNEMNGLYGSITEEDKKVMTYLYGTKKEVQNARKEVIYAGDKFKSMFGRKAYISTNEALELRAQGKLSDAAFQYMQLFRQYLYRYDTQYKEQQDRFNFEAPTFVPDVMAQSDHNQSDSEFTRAVRQAYGIDISSKSDRRFRKELYKAMDTSPEGGMTLENLTGKFGQEYYKYEGLTVSEVKRDLFWPDKVKDDAANNNKSIREILKERIIAFEKLRRHARENSTNRYVENERDLKVQGGFSKGLILRTEQFHEANRMLLNSLIANYYTRAVSPFAFHAEEKYKMKAPDRNPIMSRWMTRYITEGIFHHTPQDMKDFRWYHHAFGATVSGISLGLNLRSGIGNLTQGQSQTYILKPDAYKKALSRIGQLSKVINIMHANHVGMLVEDITFKQSDKIWEGAMKTGFWITEKVENINQGLGFLGSMTEEELSWYNEDGSPKDPQRKMSPYRIHQIESLVRNINGDYGHNRPLYRSNPWLMELGRFKFGWWQTMINNHFGASYVDPWGEEHLSIAETVTRSLQRIILKMKKNFSGESTMEFAAKALGKDGAKVFETQLSDTPEEARMRVLNPLSVNSELSVTVFEINTDQGMKYYALEPGRTVSVYARMALEMLSDINKRDYLSKNAADRENYGKLHREAGLLAAYGVPAMTAYWIVAGLMAGGGDPDRDDNVEILDALLYSINRSWVVNLFRSEPLAPVEPLKNLSAVSDKEYKLIQFYSWLNDYFKRSAMDVATPYLPQQYSTLTDLTRVPAAGALGSLLMAGWYGVSDPTAKMESTNVKLGYTAQSNKALWYLRQVLPARYVFRQLYEGINIAGLQLTPGYLEKEDIETAEIYLKSKSAFKEMFKYVYGIEGHEFDPSSPQDMQLWSAVQEMTSALYYAQGIKERAEKMPMEPIRNLQYTGKQKIEKEKNSLSVPVETTRKWKKQFGID